MTCSASITGFKFGLGQASSWLLSVATTASFDDEGPLVTEYSPTDLAAQLKSGLLSFPVTHFTDDLEFDEAGYRKHLAWLAEHPVAGLFAAGGTGEGFSLTFEETDRVVRAAVDEVAGAVPVLAPATGSTANAIAQAEAAEAAGADGLLLMPPYLTEAEPGRAGRARQPGLRRPPGSASSSTAAPTPSCTTRPSRPSPTATRP